MHLILLIAERPIKVLDHELGRPGLLALHAARVGGGPDEVGAHTDLARREAAIAIFTLNDFAGALGVCFTADVAAHFADYICVFSCWYRLTPVKKEGKSFQFYFEQ